MNLYQELAAARKRSAIRHGMISRLDPQARNKMLCRVKTLRLVKLGLLVKRDRCERCDSSRRIQCHHHDYNDPANVSWLCQRCHATWHGPTWSGAGRLFSDFVKVD